MPGKDSLYIETRPWFNFCLANLIPILSTFSLQFLIAMIDKLGHMVSAVYPIIPWGMVSDWGT